MTVHCMPCLMLHLTLTLASCESIQARVERSPMVFMYGLCESGRLQSQTEHKAESVLSHHSSNSVPRLVTLIITLNYLYVALGGKYLKYTETAGISYNYNKT